MGKFGCRGLRICIMWSIFVLAIFSVLRHPLSALAEPMLPQQYLLQIQDKQLSVHAHQVSFRQILQDLESKSGIKTKIMGDVEDKLVSVDIDSLSFESIDDLLNGMGLTNFSVLYDTVAATKVIYVLAEGLDVAEVFKDNPTIKKIAPPDNPPFIPADFSRNSRPKTIKGKDLVSIVNGKNNTPISYVANEILLKFHLGVTEQEISTLLQKYNLTKAATSAELAKIGYVKAIVQDGRDVSDVIKVVRQVLSLKITEPDYVANVLTTVSDPLYPKQWYIPATNFDKTWGELKNKAAVKVAVIDSGIESNHPDLNGKVLAGFDFVNNDDDPSDDNGHGTFVSGIIAASANDVGIKGLYDYAKILPVKVIDQNGVGTYEDAAAGIIFAADHGAKVINLSIGGYAFSYLLQDSVDYALERGCILVAAGGNDGIEQPIYPAAYPDIIGVSALGQNDDIWSSSNRGNHVDVTAPGVGCISAGQNGKYVYASGTSVSAAMVSAQAAMLASERPTLSGSAVQRLISQTARDLGEEGKDVIFGNGVIDVAESLSTQLDAFHDIAVSGIHVDTNKVLSGGDVYAVIKFENRGTYPAEEINFKISFNDKILINKSGIKINDKFEIEIKLPQLNAAKNKFILQAEASLKYKEMSLDNNTLSVTYQYKYDSEDKLYILYKNKPYVHAWTALQAYEILPPGSLKDEISGYLYGGAAPDDLFGINHIWPDDYSVPSNWLAPFDDGASVFEGTFDEDEDDYGLCPSPAGDAPLQHFWNPDQGIDYGLKLGLYGCDDRNHSSIWRAQKWWDVAINQYLLGNESLAYYYLGRIVHLLGDMGVPDHVKLDQHPGREILNIVSDDFSNYEEYTQIYYRTVTGYGNPKDISTLPLSLPSSYVVQGYDSDLSKLFYNMSQFAQHFDSSDPDLGDGNNIEFGSSTIDMGLSITEFGNGNMKQSYNAVAYLNEGYDKIDPNSNIVVVWEKFNELGGYYIMILPQKRGHLI